MLQGWTLHEWTNQHDVARMDIAAVDLSARCGKGGQCGRKKTYPSKLNVRDKNVSIDFVHPRKTEITKQTEISNY